MDEHAVREHRAEREQIRRDPEAERRPETPPALAADGDAAPESVRDDVHGIIKNDRSDRYCGSSRYTLTFLSKSLALFYR